MAVDCPYLMDVSMLIEKASFCLVPAARFKMGEGEDAHGVRLDAYEIGRFPVTCADYQPFVDLGLSAAPRGWQDGRYYPLWKDHPVTFVSWHDALRFCVWLNEKHATFCYRLPSEAEWEFAARGPDALTFPWGHAFDKTRCANWENGAGCTTRVDAFPASTSPFGVWDMVGNVWEWTSSRYDPYPYCATDGREDVAEVDAWRTLRGGSWYDTDWGVRAARRFGSPPQMRTHNTGFRLVRQRLEKEV